MDKMPGYNKLVRINLKRLFILVIFCTVMWIQSIGLFFTCEDIHLLSDFISGTSEIISTSYGQFSPLYKLIIFAVGHFTGFNPVSFHILLLALHLMNVLLLYRILIYILGDSLVPLISALAWGILPQYAGAVFTVTGVRISVAALFIFLAVSSYLKSKAGNNKTGRIFPLIFFSAAILCHEVALYSIFLFFALEYLLTGKIKKSIKELMPFIIIAIVGTISITCTIIVHNPTALKNALSGILNIPSSFLYNTLYIIFGAQYHASLLLSLIFIALYFGLYIILRDRKIRFFLILHLLLLFPFILSPLQTQSNIYIASPWLLTLIISEISKYIKNYRESIARFIAYALVGLFMLVSIVRLQIEHRDYRIYTEMHRSIAEHGKIFLKSGCKPGNYYFVVTGVDPAITVELVKADQGFEKNWTLKEKRVAGLIEFDSLINYLLIAQNKSENNPHFSRVEISRLKPDVIHKSSFIIEYNRNIGFYVEKLNRTALENIYTSRKLQRFFNLFLCEKSY